MPIMKEKSVNYEQVIMCTNCFHGEKIKISDGVTVESLRSKEEKSLIDIDDIYFYRSGMKITCKNCGKKDDNAALIDVDIYPTIKELNKKGYYTSYCCSGHISESEKISCYAYVAFHPVPAIMENSIYRSNLSTNLPSSWNLEEDRWVGNYQIIIRVRDEVQDNDPEKNYLKEIYQWAKQLPEMDWNRCKRNLQISKVKGGREYDN